MAQKERVAVGCDLSDLDKQLGAIVAQLDVTEEDFNTLSNFMFKRIIEAYKAGYEDGKKLG